MNRQGIEMIVYIILGLMIAAIVMTFAPPLIDQITNSAKGCGTLQSWIQDLSAGATQQC